ncbi:MAG: hypothetical protein M1389_11945 [Chloroflexi bacterium]|nr:hypothetical protein [Chloroflexota bacterium]
MLPSDHVKYSTIAALGLAPLLKRRILSFWAGAVLIDVDHYLWYIAQFRDFSLIRAWAYLRVRHSRRDKVKLEPRPVILLHTFEVLLPLAFVAVRSGWGKAMLGGMLFHIALDSYKDWQFNGKFDREYSLVGIIWDRIASSKRRRLPGR